MRLQKSINPKIALVALLLIFSLGVLATALHSIRIENKHSSLFSSHIYDLNLLSQFNSKWVAALEKTKGLSLIDFDEIAQYTKEIRAKIADLDNSGLLNEDLVGKETTEEYQYFKNMFEVKYEAIQRYKSEKAVLRNSANYLENSANEAIANIKNSKIKEDIKHTTSSLLNYLLLNISYWEEKSKAHFPNLESNAIRNESKAGKEKLATYSKHANIILEYSPRVIDMLETAKEVDIYNLTKNISNTYLARQANSSEIVSYWKNILIGAGIASALALFWLLKLIFSRPKRVLVSHRAA